MVDYQTFTLGVGGKHQIQGIKVNTLGCYSVKTGAGVASEISISVNKGKWFPLRGGQAMNSKNPITQLDFINQTGASVTMRLLLTDMILCFGFTQ